MAKLRCGLSVFTVLALSFAVIVPSQTSSNPVLRGTTHGLPAPLSAEVSVWY
jgi:hypothetical protein